MSVHVILCRLLHNEECNSKDCNDSFQNRNRAFLCKQVELNLEKTVNIRDGYSLENQRRVQLIN